MSEAALAGPGAAPVIILVRSQMPENIGMAARAMANFGLSEMRLVAPRDGWPPVGVEGEAALAAASGARQIVEQAVVFDTVEAAIGDLTHVFATTARERGQAKPVVLPDQGMVDAAGLIASGARIGILFGPERTGLDNDDVSLADTVLTFPVDPAFASLNLAQAVLLVSYEWMKASGQAAAPFELPHHTGPAKKASLIAFFRFLEAELVRVGFYTNPERKPIMVRNFRNILHRMRLTEQDVRTLRGALAALIRGERPPRDKAGSQPGDAG